MYDALATAGILDRVLMHQHLIDAAEIAAVIRQRRRAQLLRRTAYCLLIGLPVLTLLMAVRTHSTSAPIAPEHTQTKAVRLTQSVPSTALNDTTQSSVVPSPNPESTDLSASRESDVSLQLRMQSTLTTQHPLLQSE